LIETVPDILARIVARKREELASDTRVPTGELALRAEVALAGRRNFSAAIKRNGGRPRVIAEIKKASPSKGVLAEDFEPARIAREYAAGGAAALSVLTDESFFQGSLADLECARSSVTMPVLRKDFTLDSYHVLQAAAHSADAILLIAAILEEHELRDLREFAARWEMEALVEVHDEAEMEKAVASGAQIIGVNNRNLATFEVSLETSLRLAERMPSGVVRVSESGIHSAADVRRLADAGYHALLVGEHLMLAPQPADALRALLA
jgi:indole-3-glycerol phosphate synthase